MTLRELAARLGLSQTTVSRALNGYPEVSQATRRRVLEAAAQLNYIPDARARSLATGRAMAVGHVIPAASRHELVNPIFADFNAGASTVYEKEGYAMMLTLVADSNQESVYRGIAARGRVDGVIVQMPRPGDERIAMLKRIGLPFVVHGRVYEADRAYSWVDIDNARAAALATGHLTGLGHRRIALLNGPVDLNFAQRRRHGYETALGAAGIEPDPALIRSAPMTEGYGFAATMELCALPCRPTAILASSLPVAIGVRRAADALGLRQGETLSIVTHDDDLGYLRNGTESEPVFTAVRSSMHKAGSEAARILMRLIANPESGPHHRMMAAEFVHGPSSGPAPD